MLNLTGISKTYPGGVHALQDIPLDVPRGMFGLLGPNGAGKSSLMRTIATLQQPDRGSIKFNGIDILQDQTALRRALGYLPQEFGAYPRTSALAMLKHLAALKGIHGSQRQKVVENLLVKTNLWDARNKSVDKFSGGMKQRYGIAQALLGDPALLIVDEPTAGLDPAERRRFLNVLAEVGEGTVVILSTHIVELIPFFYSRLAQIPLLITYPPEPAQTVWITELVQDKALAPVGRDQIHSDAEGVSTVLRELADAILRREVSDLEQILTDDYVGLLPEILNNGGYAHGDTINKTQQIAAVEKHRSSVEKFEFHNLRVFPAKGGEMGAVAVFIGAPLFRIDGLDSNRKCGYYIRLDKQPEQWKVSLIKMEPTFDMTSPSSPSGGSGEAVFEFEFDPDGKKLKNRK